MNELKKILACAALMFVAYAPLSNASVISLPGIPEAGDPSFTNSAKINLFNLGGSYLLAASNSGSAITFNNESVHVSSSASHPAYFLLTALFSNNGSYVANTGTLSISGEIPFPFANLPGVFVSGDLLTAKLENFAFNANTIGFSTNQISGLGTLWGTAESVYLSASNLANTLGFASGTLVATTSPINVSAITTVPVPGAGWLISSALGLFTLLRRKQVALG